MANNKQFTKWLQGQLSSLGAEIPKSGTNDKQTQAAIRDFQKAAGIRVTGTATAETVQAIRKFAPQTMKASAKIGAGNSAGTVAATLRPPPIGTTDTSLTGGFGDTPFGGRFDPTLQGTLGPQPPDIRTEGYGMSRTGPGTSREAFSDAFATPPLDPAMEQGLSIRTGNSPLAMGDMPPMVQVGAPSGIGSDYAADAGATQDSKKMEEELTRQILEMLLRGANRPSAPPPPEVAI